MSTHYDTETLSHSAALMSEVAADPTNGYHAGDPAEIEHLRAQAVAVEAGEADPPQWALDIVHPPRARRSNGLPEASDSTGCGPV